MVGGGVRKSGNTNTRWEGAIPCFIALLCKEGVPEVIIVTHMRRGIRLTVDAPYLRERRRRTPDG